MKRSVLAWLLRLQITSLPDSRQVKTRGRKLRNLRPSWSRNLHFEDVRAQHLSHSAFVHGEEASANPIPSVIVVRVINADHYLNLRLSPETRTVRRAQRHARIEVRISIFAICADHFNPRFVIRTEAQIIIGLQFKANFFGSRHFVFRTELDPVAADSDAISFSLIGTRNFVLRAG